MSNRRIETAYFAGFAIGLLLGSLAVERHWSTFSWQRFVWYAIGTIVLGLLEWRWGSHAKPEESS